MKIQRIVLIVVFVLAAQVISAQSFINKVTQSVAEDVIIGGKGWGKIILGTPKSDIEKLLGVPDTKSDYFSLYGKSGIYVYYSKDQLAREISFEITIGSHQTSFKGKPDKKLKWGATSADVIKIYGTPLKKRSEKYLEIFLNSIIYNNAEFYFANDQLVRINVFDGSNRLRSFQPSN